MQIYYMYIIDICQYRYHVEYIAQTPFHGSLTLKLYHSLQVNVCGRVCLKRTTYDKSVVFGMQLY